MSIRRRVGALAGAAVLTGGLAVGVAVELPGTASASVCTGTISSPCTILGTVTLTGGVLTMLAPTTLTWGPLSVTGAPQSAVDTLVTDTGYEISDLTGSSAGWKVTAAATTFTYVGTPPAGTAATFSDTGTLLNVGSTASESATTVPSATCLIAGTCTVPTGGEPTYPLAVTTAATSPTPVLLYKAAAGSGAGLTEIGTTALLGTNPAAWWVNVPANPAAGAYTSTITMTIASGP
jgi:WxL domain surface cell wall-binding